MISPLRLLSIIFNRTAFPVAGVSVITIVDKIF